MGNTSNIRIGIVLSSVPAYSETFFQTKINGLIDNGFDVVLFAKGKRNPAIKAKLVTPYPVFKSRLIMIGLVGVVLAWTFLRSPIRFIKYVKFLRVQMLGVVNIVERIYLNAHILPNNLNWLHYGFITQAIGKEELAKVMDAKMGVSIRGFDISIFPLMNPDKLSKTWLYIDKLHTISDDLLELAKRNGLPEQIRIQKIRPAIELEKFRKSQVTAPENCQEVKIMTVARLNWKKGLEYALEACLLLKNAGVKFSYTIVGEGEEREKLTFLIDQMNLRSEVCLIGKLSQAEIVALMHTSNIYLQPSIQEGFCNSVLEAQAAGLLCVGSDAEGLSENILDKETGWIVPKRDAVSLANKILEIIKLDSKCRREIIDRAVSRVATQFTSAAQIGLWIKFYKE